MNQPLRNLLSAVTLLLVASGWQPLTAQPVAFSTESDIVMVGDVHGAYPQLVAILQHAGLVDEALNWQGGATHFVSTGDLMDRGPSSRKVMDLLIKLQAQARQQQGFVHVLLGNHEILNLTGDWRYISAGEYQEFAADESPQMRARYLTQFTKGYTGNAGDDLEARFNQRFPAGFFARLEAFLPAGYYGTWLHSLPLVIKINQHVFTHGGLSVKTMGIPLEQLNQQLKRSLEDYTGNWQKLIASGRVAAYTDFSVRHQAISELSANTITRQLLDSLGDLLFSLDSPTWYRGNALCHPLFEAQLLEQLLSQWEATTLWVGHTTADTVRQRFGQKLLLMDTGMLSSVYGGQPIYARIFGSKSAADKPHRWQFYNALSGKTVQPSSVPARASANPNGMDDQQVEAFLLNADVVASQKLGEGITNPLKITLQKNGRTLHAVFKHHDSGPPKNASRRSFANDLVDRYQYDVAAYKLDRLLGLHTVPVAVERKIDGTKGALQLWIDGLINYKKMKRDNITYDGFCDYSRQRQMMDVFDYLIHNEDRNQTNIAFTQHDWQLWFIDHTRAFHSEVRKPKLLMQSDLILTDEFRQRLERLNRDNLAILAPYLKSRQIEALLKRRDRLLNQDT